VRLPQIPLSIHNFDYLEFGSKTLTTRLGRWRKTLLDSDIFDEIPPILVWSLTRGQELAKSIVSYCKIYGNGHQEIIFIFS